jgi:hypothetical protein
MSLTALSSIPQDEIKANLEVDLTDFFPGEEKVIVTFREPKIPDMYPNGSAIERLRISFPDMIIDQLQSCYIIGRCYVRSEKDAQTIDPVKDICKLALRNKRAYLRIFIEFQKAFLVDFNQEIKNSGNV